MLVYRVSFGDGEGDYVVHARNADEATDIAVGHAIAYEERMDAGDSFAGQIDFGILEKEVSILREGWCCADWGFGLQVCRYLRRSI